MSEKRKEQDELDEQSETRREESEELDIEGEWAAAREAAGLEDDAAGEASVEAQSGGEGRRERVPAPYLSPFTCLYAGFALGPAATLVIALLVSPKRLTWRRAAIFFALSGMTWTIVQAITHQGMGLTGSWTSLRLVRASANFVGGVAALLVWRFEDATTFLTHRDVILRSLGAVALLMAGFFALPSWVLLLLGW